MAEREKRACVALGSNLGDRAALLDAAVCGLRATPGVRVLRESPRYETDPVGGPEQADYLNAAVVVATTLSAQELLERLHELERQAGRTRGPERNAPRPLDLDLLLYADEKIAAPGLSVPHPRLHERAFVLEPLADIAPQWIHPLLGVSIGELAGRMRDPAAVRRVP